MKRSSKDFGLQQLQPFSYEICEPHMMTEEKTVPRTAACLELLLFFCYFLLFTRLLAENTFSSRSTNNKEYLWLGLSVAVPENR